ncbi:MAG: hypothetical protein IMZ69_11940 [Spirochaetes bacterium]|nr:hypothetical protein [Spirochaetota bacterium]
MSSNDASNGFLDNSPLRIDPRTVQTDWKVKYEALCDKLMHELTPGGSEFYRDPDRCIEFARYIRGSDFDFRKRVMLHLRKHPLLFWHWRRSHGAQI